MEFIHLFTVLISIIFLSKIIAKVTKTVDTLWYILLGLIGIQYLIPVDMHLLENWAMMGVIFVMFFTGWKEDLFSFIFDLWKNKWIAVSGAIGPFIGAFLAFTLLNFSIQESIVAGFIFTSTAIPYTISVLRSMGLDRTKAARAVTSSSVTDNLLSVLLAIGILPAYAMLVQQGGDASLGVIWVDMLKQVGLIAGAFGIFAILGFFVLPDPRMKWNISIPNILQQDGFLARITYKIFQIRKLPGFNDVSRILANVRIGLPLTLLLLFGLSLIAHKLGLHPAITAYLTGLILNKEMFDLSHLNVEKSLEELPISHENLEIFFFFLQEWIGPIFFIHLGSLLIINWSEAWHVVIYGIVAGIIIALFQFVSAYLAARYNSKLPQHESLLVGFAMIPYDIIAFVVLGIATTTGLVTEAGAFAMSIMASILVLNIITTASIYWYKPRYLQAEKEFQSQKIKQGV